MVVVCLIDPKPEPVPRCVRGTPQSSRRGDNFGGHANRPYYVDRWTGQNDPRDHRLLEDRNYKRLVVCGQRHTNPMRGNLARSIRHRSIFTA